MLIEEGELTQEEYHYMGLNEPDLLDDEEVLQNREILLTMTYERSNFLKSPAYQAFAAENQWWQEDYALFMALKQYFEGAGWYEWPDDILMRKERAMEFYRRELRFEIEFQRYLQFRFFQQFEKLKIYAKEHGIQIVGQIPMYLNTDSVDVWAHAELFSADSSMDGCAQYYWKNHKETDYVWL